MKIFRNVEYRQNVYMQFILQSQNVLSYKIRKKLKLLLQMYNVLCAHDLLMFNYMKISITFLKNFVKY